MSEFSFHRLILRPNHELQRMTRFASSCCSGVFMRVIAEQGRSAAFARRAITEQPKNRKNNHYEATNHLHHPADRRAVPHE